MGNIESVLIYMQCSTYMYIQYVQSSGYNACAAVIAILPLTQVGRGNELVDRTALKCLPPHIVDVKKC